MGPLAFLITFRTYGTWLHGDSRGSVDRRHRSPGSPMLSSRPMLEMRERSQLQHPLIALGADRRGIVSETIHEVCGHRGWELHALAVRTEHVHVVIGAPADTAPEAMMVTLKAWATRRMVERRALAPRVRAWSRHGSTRYLWTPEGVASACRYVIDGQGEDLPVSRP